MQILFQHLVPLENCEVIMFTQCWSYLQGVHLLRWRASFMYFFSFGLLLASLQTVILSFVHLISTNMHVVYIYLILNLAMILWHFLFRGWSVLLEVFGQWSGTSWVYFKAVFPKILHDFPHFGPISSPQNFDFSVFQHSILKGQCCSYWPCWSQMLNLYGIGNSRMWPRCVQMC